MKKSIFKDILNWILTLSLLAYCGYFLYSTLPINTCNAVLTFKIQSIDPRFNLSETQAISYAQSAANLWNKGLGKKVLQYDPNGTVRISFVYDERQKKTIENNILEEVAKNQKDELTNVKQNIQIQKENFLSIKSEYEQGVNQFKEDLKNYNQKVMEVNERGGANNNEMISLNEERVNLLKQETYLNNKADEINSYLDKLNGNVDEYNNKVVKINNVINKINNNSLGQFEEGTYSNNEITLYEYDDVNSLKRLLAHELGHALGLDHTKDPNSIMYYINKGDNFILTKDDIEEYNLLCKAIN